MSRPSQAPDAAPAMSDATGGEAAGHALDLLQVGADDEAVLDRELLVGQVVDGLLGVGVGVEDAERLRELEREDLRHAASLLTTTAAQAL